MDYKRLFLYFALAFIVFSLWTEWQKDNVAAPVAPTTINQSNVPTAPAAAISATTPTVPATSQQTIPTVSAVPAERIITVQTDVLNVKIDTLGGHIIAASLPKYPATVKTPNVPVVIMSAAPDSYYVAESGITGPQGPDTEKGVAQYTATQTSYTLANDQKTLDVAISWKNNKGLEVIKTFHFERGDYAIHVSYNIQNHSDKPWSGNIYAQIRQKELAAPCGLFHVSNFIGGAISTPEKPYQKITYDTLNKEELSKNARGGWLAFQQRYFLTAWVPNQQQTNHYYSSVDANKIATLGFIGPTITVPANGQFNTTTTFYVGPEIGDMLKKIAPHLDLTIDFGWLWWLSIIILWVMEHIHRVVGNWGWSIVIVTLLIKLLFYKFSAISYRSMAKMRQLQPKLAELKQRYGDDKQKISQATMELYRKEKVNPLGGCLPILVQIPVFIALYYVLIESVQLRQAPFIFWIHDLSAKDPYYVLPILMGISMFFQQRLNPAPPDPVQARVMQFMPVMFTIFFMTFPSGLVLYWLTNNVLTIIQQWHITRSLEKKIENKIEKSIEKFKHRK